MLRPGSTNKTAHLLADMTNGLSDGIVVLLALTAGLGRVVEDINSLYIAAGIAILVGSISIAVSRYFSEKEGVEDDHAEHEAASLAHLGFSEQTRREIEAEMQQEEKSEVEKLLDQEIDVTEAKKSGANMALFYILGGLFPLLPYVMMEDRQMAFICSAIIAVLCLALVGYIKSVVYERNIIAEMSRLCITGALAGGAGYILGGIFL
jgi:VIT1/CCC1 family predicted Fe2+/Mn2+ transporter